MNFSVKQVVKTKKAIRVKTIAIVNAYNEIAGPFTVLNNFLNYIEEENLFFILFIPPGKNDLDFKNRNVKVVYTPVLPLDKDFFSIKIIRYFLESFYIFFKFIYFFRKFKVDILHNNSSNLFLQSFSAIVTRVKVVYHVREVWNTRSKFSKLLYYFIVRVSHKIICITNTVKQNNFSQNDIRRFSGKFIVIPDCVDTNLYRSVYAHKDKNEVIISFVGRISPIKGLDILLKAYEILMSRNLANNLKLRIIGDIPKTNSYYKGYRKHILELVERCRVYAHCKIELLGFRNDVAKLLQQSHLLILPSRIEEGLGLVLIEGLLTNNFIITSNLGGQKEILELMECGFLFENENATELALKIEAYLADKESYSSLIAEKQTAALAIFSPEAYCDTVLKVYSQII